MNIDLNETTLPKLLKMNADRYANRKTALRIKGLGIWKQVSWKEYADNVRHLSLGFINSGFARNENLAIISSNRPESIYAEIAAQAAGGISLGLYQDSTASEIVSALNRFDVTVVVAEDQEQVDKVLESLNQLPKIKKIIYINKRGLRKYNQEELISFTDICSKGKNIDEDDPGIYPQMLAAGKCDDTAIICLTSGTTGDPKGAMLSHRNLLSMSLAFNEVEPKRDTDEFVSLLPIAWFGEQMMSVAAALVSGFTVNFPENRETAMEDMREIGPHILLSPPNIWESIAASVRVRMMDSTPFKKFMYRTFMPIGDKVSECRLNGTPVPLSLSIGYFFGEICLFRALKDRLGLSRVRTALTGGAPLGLEVLRFFHAIGINLKQLYGQTEISGISCMHRSDNINGATVGLPLPGIEIKIAAHGEILSKGPAVFKGYYGDEESTRKTVVDGWLHSGDAGYFDENNHLVFLDRLNDLIPLENGSSIPTQLIENRLKFSPYIKEAVLVGREGRNLSVLIGIEAKTIGKWASDNKLAFTGYSDLASRVEVVARIENEIAAVNETVPEQARIRRFALLYKDLDADEGELTRTGKLKRETVELLYSDLISAMNTGRESVGIDKTIVFPDGKTGRIQSTVIIRQI